MSREGRAQPIQPFASHGFLGNTPANGVLPGRVVVCENDDRRRRTPPLQPVIINGLYATMAAPTAGPPAPTFSILADRPRAAAPIQPVVVKHGFLGNAPPNGVTPPAAVNVDRADQRGRYGPLDPITLNGILASLNGAPTVLPAGPFVVPIDERKRFLAQLPSTVIHGADDPDPPLPNIVEPAERRRRVTPDPLSISGALAAFFDASFVAPPKPVVFVPDLPQRATLQPILLLGRTLSPVLAAAIYTQSFTGQPAALDLDGAAASNRFGGTADELALTGTPAGNQYRTSKPGQA